MNRLLLSFLLLCPATANAQSLLDTAKQKPTR